jgi:Holliday junction resolvase-like predicted endonuclease
MKKAERALKDLLKLADILKLKVSDSKKEKLLKKAHKEWTLKYTTKDMWKFRLDFHLACVKELCKMLRKCYNK